MMVHALNGGWSFTWRPPAAGPHRWCDSVSLKMRAARTGSSRSRCGVLFYGGDDFLITEGDGL